VPTSKTPNPLFHFFGTVDGALCTITVAVPVRRAPQEWAAKVEMTGALRLDVNVYGASKKQAAELALGLCHSEVRGRQLASTTGGVVHLPGKPLPGLGDGSDDGVRAKSGLAACLVEEKDGRLRLVLDDVVRSGAGWADRFFLTHRRFEKQRVLDCRLSQRELAEIGLIVMGRLVASSRGRLTGFPRKKKAKRGRP
jgi:hypothetical protein